MCRWLRLAFIGVCMSVAVGKVTALPSCADVGINNGILVIPNGTTSIPNNEYENCDNITGVTFNTDGALNVIDSEAFTYADGFTEVTIPASVTSIAIFAFYACDELARVVFDTTNGPSNLNTIHNGVFADNFKLEVFEMPESVTSMGVNILNNCPKLNRVIVHGSSPWTDAASLANFVESLCDPDGSHNGEACIEGSGTRASEIINHNSNDCNLTLCLTSEDETDTDDDNLSPGAIAGIAVGGTVFLALVAYGIYRHTISSKSSSPKTTVGSLIF